MCLNRCLVVFIFFNVFKPANSGLNVLKLVLTQHVPFGGGDDNLPTEVVFSGDLNWRSPEYCRGFDPRRHQSPKMSHPKKTPEDVPSLYPS